MALFGWVSVFLSFFLGICAAHKIFEDDFYWQLRAGEEFLRTWHWSNVDQWSYTVAGAPWSNYEWLSCVVFRGVYQIGHEPACVVLRIVMVASLFLLLASLIGKKLSDKAPAEKWLALFILLPWVFTILQFRLQLRPELFGLIILVGFFRLWVSGRALRTQLALTIAGIIFWANFHGGTAVFGLFFALIWLGSLPGVSWTKRFWGGGLMLGAFFMTPLGFRILPVLLDHYQYNQSVPNLEWQSFAWSFLDPRTNGFSISLWLIFSLLGLFSVVRSEFLSPIGRGITFCVFTYLSFAKIRVIPYQCLFLVPCLLSLEERAEWMRWPFFKRSLAVVATVLWLVVIPVQEFRFFERFGFSVDPEQFPVSIYQFLKEIHPDKNIFAGFLGGGYQLWALPDYPVFVDPRDILYNPIKDRMMEAMAKPEAFSSLIHDYQINTVLFFANPFQPSTEKFLAPTEWALVYFDNKQMVFLKRTLKNVDLVFKYEYRYLNPAKSSASYFAGALQSVEDRQKFVEELNRCIAHEPKNIYCRSVQAGLLAVQRTDASLNEATQLLRETSAYALKIRPPLLLYLRPIYTLLGDSVGLTAVDSRLNALSETGPGIWNF